MIILGGQDGMKNFGPRLWECIMKRFGASILYYVQLYRYDVV